MRQPQAQKVSPRRMSKAGSLSCFAKTVIGLIQQQRKQWPMKLACHLKLALHLTFVHDKWNGDEGTFALEERTEESI